MPAWTALGVKSRIKVALVVWAKGTGAAGLESTALPPPLLDGLDEEPHPERAERAAMTNTPQRVTRARARP